MSVEWLTVEFVAVTQQHAEQKATRRTKERRKYLLCGALIINKV
jgi:hypothetical protein